MKKDGDLMNELMRKETKKIEDMIYEIRGKQVMLDSDLAYLYHCKNGTKTINLAVKRHINRFPERFMFRLSKEEVDNLRFQSETANSISAMSRTNPYAFTEQGVAMLATVLKTEVAEVMSVRIMDAFVLMRKYISNNLIELNEVKSMVIKHDNEIRLLQESFNQFEERTNSIYFEGQIYDAYSKIVDILSIAKNNIVIIDAYADKSVLDIISKLEVNVTLICKSNSFLKQIDVDKYIKQYKNLKVIFDDTFHDRYFILDKSIVYHCGTSINHAGNKTFSINLLTDKEVKNELIKIVKGLLRE